MKEVIKYIIIWLIFLVMVSTFTYCISFCWHKAEEVVLLSANYELMEKLETMDAD